MSVDMHFVRPDMHVVPHVPFAHVSPIAQTLPHMPQFMGSVCVLTQLIPHWTRLGAHELEHLLAEQTSFAAHFTPHAPQCRGLLLVETQASPHRVVPIGHSTVHIPNEHCAPSGHLLPHLPQFSRSRVVTVQVPLQSVEPVPHTFPLLQAAMSVPRPTSAARTKSSGINFTQTTFFVRMRSSSHIILHLEMDN
jgi:hypothetical protein